MFAWFERHSRISLAISLLICAGIFYISSLSFSGGRAGSEMFANIYHIGVFFLLAFFLFISLVRGKEKEYMPIIVVMVILYGISDEIHQYFVPGRSLAPHDVLMDSIGICGAWIIYSIRLRWKNLLIK